MKGRRRVRMGTRGSRLALAQAQRVAAALCRRWPGLVVETVVIRTRGDVTVRPLGELGGDGLFTRAIEEALLEGRVDLAVHSAKDLPTRLAGGCVVAAWPERASVADVLVSRTGAGLAELPPGARVGTSSPRRAALLRELRPDLAVVPLRGNVETRLRRVEEGEVDAAVLAEAGLVRLGLETCRTQRLDPAVFVPAAGQGALAVEVRADDGQAAALAAAIDDPTTAAAVRAERAFLAAAGTGCQTPAGCWARVEGEQLALTAFIVSPDGAVVRGERRGAVDEAEALGAGLAREVVERAGRRSP